MAYRLIALDLDETLLNENMAVSERSRRSLAGAMEKGVKVTIATGRMFSSSAPYARELKINAPLIAYHGALIRSMEEEKIYYYRPVELSLSQQIVAEVQEKGYHVNLFLDERLYIKEFNEFTRRYQTIAPSTRLNPVGDLVKYLQKVKKEPAKISVICREEQLEELEQHLEGRYNGKIKCMRSLPGFLEITNPRATKGQALQMLARMLGVKREEVVAFGDSYNDLDMLEYAGLGVAVENARPRIKEVADLVTASNRRDGVARVVEKYVLGEI